MVTDVKFLLQNIVEHGYEGTVEFRSTSKARFTVDI